MRYLSNASTGRQGIAIADAAIERGWRVLFVHGPIEGEIPGGAESHGVTTTREMLDRCRELHPESDVVIGAAAVADFRPLRVERDKRKSGTRWQLELEPTEDILGALAKSKGPRIHVGFALESTDLEQNARRKLRAKELDLIVANPPGAIGADASRYLLLGADGSREELGRLTKIELASRLLDRVATLLRDR